MAMQEVNESNYDETVLKSDKPFLLDFSATWCGPCQILKPILEELSTELGDSAVIGHVDVDQNSGLAQKHAVTSVPTMILFKNGEVQEQMRGVMPKSVILDKIKSAIG